VIELGVSVGASPGFLNRIIRFCLERKLIVAILCIGIIVWGLLVAPFDWEIGGLPRDPVPVDAIPDIGENQQIVFTEWMGRSPQDVEDQIGYPLTVSLLGIPGVKTVRSYSMFGFSSIYVIFNEDVEFYWSRSRILEKLASLPSATLPPKVKPALGPDATALGQIFWYTLEGRDKDGQPTGGWDPQELRTVQDWYVRYSLQSAQGVSEVASVGGYVKEYQIDVDPNAMRAHRVTLQDVFKAVQGSNVDVGARTIEINSVEYVIRGLGFIKTLEDIGDIVVQVNENVPIRVKDVAKVAQGPALRRGALDKEGAEAVGGVVVARYGDNPLATINAIKKKIEEISTGLPKKTLSDGRVSQVTIVPFYDRSGLIQKTLETLNTALIDEILITIIVVIVMVGHLRSSMLIAGLLPLAVLMCFIAMKTFKIDANIVALSGIAIAIGTMVDMGVILCENILRQLEEAPEGSNSLEVIYQATIEVSGAVTTAVATTIVSFLPVFTMEGAEGKLFQPLAYTKTFSLLASIIVALTVIPPAAHLLLGRSKDRSIIGYLFTRGLLLLAGLVAMIWIKVWFGVVILAYGVYLILESRLTPRVKSSVGSCVNVLCVVAVGYILTEHWFPLGQDASLALNLTFVALCLGGLLGGFQLFMLVYPRLLRFCLEHKFIFLSIPAAIIVAGMVIWWGFGNVFSFVLNHSDRVGVSSQVLRETVLWTGGSKNFPGLGKQFMPDLDEGSFLYMPTTMPHASIGEAQDVLEKIDKAMYAIPEVDQVVGKLGRAETPLDPAPISMIETVVNYKSEYKTDAQGHRLRFRYNKERKEFARDGAGELIGDDNGRPFRQWRSHIKSADDIWKEIVRVAKIPGTTSAPKLQPIAARIVMLQSGMRAPMGIKIKGPDLETLDRVGVKMERLLKEVPGVEAAAVIADRVVGKPYLEIDIDRQAIARYGVKIRDVQDVIEVAIGGKTLTKTVEGRERYPVRVRYMRELRSDVESIKRILVAGAGGVQIPLAQLTKINFIKGPQVIKSEDTFLISYVLFDKKRGFAEVDVVERCQKYLKDKIASGELELPAGVSYTFAGSYENQVRAQKRLSIVLPLALFVIFVILYLQFNRITTTGLVFFGILVAWSGGFIMIWLYGQPWFLNFEMFGVNLRTLFQINPINLSVAIWVGFIALFGIASDDGVVIATYLDQTFEQRKPKTVEEIREAVVTAGKRRIRPCLMTTATTILALLPILTSTGRGSDIMVPMAIPSFGGMTIELITLFVVPTLYCLIEEIQLYTRNRFVREVASNESSEE
jgi:copper/silver efflux system protein